jgi:hypothetical protein
MQCDAVGIAQTGSGLFITGEVSRQPLIRMGAGEKIIYYPNLVSEVVSNGMLDDVPADKTTSAAN